MRDPLPRLPIPLLGKDHAVLDLAICFREAYDAAAADSEAGYKKDPPAPLLSDEDAKWVSELLKDKGTR